MIDINATLFFQIVHFSIAWFLLDSFLLKSVVKEIDKENSNKLSIMKLIDLKNNEILSILEKKQIEWINYRIKFFENMPFLKGNNEIADLPEVLLINHIKLDLEKRKFLIGNISKELSRKIIHEL